MSHVEVNAENLQFCHVRCHMTPSMKSRVYHVSILLSRNNELSVQLGKCVNEHVHMHYSCFSGWVRVVNVVWVGSGKCSLGECDYKLIQLLCVQEISILHSCVWTTLCSCCHDKK